MSSLSASRPDPLPAGGSDRRWEPGTLLATTAAIALVLVTLVHPSATRMQTWPWVLICALVWLLPLGWWGARILAGDSVHLPSRLLSGGLVLLATSAVVSSWASPFANASLARAWPTLAGVSLCFALHDWLAKSKADSARRKDRIALWVALGGAAIVITSLILWWPHGSSSRNAAPFGHSTYTGGAIVLLLPWFLLRIWRTGGVQRLAWILVALGALWALVGTSSRGAVLALAVVTATSTTAALFFAPWSRSRKLLMLAAGCLLGIVVVIANPRLRELVLEQRWSDAARESNRQRSSMLAAGVRLGADRPLLGWGPGTVPLAYPRVRSQLEGGVDNVLQLHNTPIQIWATLGIAGALSVGLLLWGSAGALMRICSRKAAEDRAPAWAAAASLGGYALFALTDHQFDLPIVVALSATGLAVTTASANLGTELPFRKTARWMVVLVGAAAAAGPAFALACDLLARKSYDRGLVAWERGHSADFLTALDQASGWAPHDPFFMHQAAGELLRNADSASDPARREEFTRAAMARLTASLATEAHTELAHFNLGWLHLGRGEAAIAARHFSAAARLVPDKGGVYFGLGLALDTLGQRDDALRAFALEWLNDPRHLTSPAWEVPALAALRPAIYAEALRLLGELRPSFSRARKAEAWMRWWNGEPVSPSELGTGFTREADAFVGAFSAISNRAPVDPTYSWAQLYTAWRDREFGSAAGNDETYAAALARRAKRHPADFRAFLAAGSEDEPALLRTFRRQRIGYGVLALHPDGPVLHDVYVVQENRLVADFAPGLFPPKGWLPGRFLIALLPTSPR